MVPRPWILRAQSPHIAKSVQATQSAFASTSKLKDVRRSRERDVTEGAVLVLCFALVVMTVLRPLPHEQHGSAGEVSDEHSHRSSGLRGNVAPSLNGIRVSDMSALGQKQTFAVQKVMSALPPKADIRESGLVCQSRALYPANEKRGRRGRMLKYSGPKITEPPSFLLLISNNFF
jgi:hypothetical protein